MPYYGPSGAGDVVGPASATDAVPALFDGTTGKLLKNSTPTGTGAPVLTTSPTLVTPALGTPSALVLTNATGLPASSLTGTLSDAQFPALTGDVTTSAGAVATTIGAAKVASTMLKGGAGNPGGAWTTWSPTLTNISGGTLNYATYTQIGKTVHFRFKYTFAGAGVGTGPRITAPVTAVAYTAVPQMGTVTYQDTGTKIYMGRWYFQSTSNIEFVIHTTDATFSYTVTPTATVPHTWANTDVLTCEGTYEAA